VAVDKSLSGFEDKRESTATTPPFSPPASTATVVDAAATVVVPPQYQPVLSGLLFLLSRPS